MRGKGKLNVVGNHIARITPAYAGKSLYSKGGRVVFWDHPRLCGEKFGKTSKACSLVGSPPPMRGKAFNFRHTVKEIGITPAYAGKSLCDQLGVQVRRDHPRLCGEKKHRTYIDSKVKGSPPPMRGKADAIVDCVSVLRITPAYAGKSHLEPS